MKLFVASISLASSFLNSHHKGCEQTYTVAMNKRAIEATYTGTRDVTRRDRRQLSKFYRCLRNPNARRYVRWFTQYERSAWASRVNPPMDYAVASWYDDSGATASGSHSYYGVANKTLPFGTRIRFSYTNREVTAVVDDRGPFVAGRDFDLNQNTAAALGFDGVETVGYHVE
jgi:rare lipoprotein A (peptidoglycan hydrolase)